ncbi:hypothetical protein KPH14_003127 [Odynerus spinipes]|uniref:Uncharacterized protein n=1 Tax=Odynerus spinipes TaxID=1348599 RepID=A0AAD9RXI3_9HYME|nr:hypothetical protein KPH14_003127 [Odynerus spinipes]
MEKKKNVKHSRRHEKVVLEKKADRVAISGPYSKRELRELLLSSLSLLRSDKTDNTELESTLKKGTGLSQVDLDKIKEGKVDELSKEAEQALQDISVTKDTIKGTAEDTIKGTAEDTSAADDTITSVAKDGETDPEGRRSTKGEGKDSEESKEARKSLGDLLRERGLSESLVKSLLTNGLTDEYIRLLKALGFTDEEIERLKTAWESEVHDSTSVVESEDSCLTSTSSSDDHLSPESLYLKNFLSRALARALRDIASKKPYDPIEYLGHWLLHVKICEEREKCRKEFEMDLMIERERYLMMNIKHEERWIGTLDEFCGTDFINCSSNLKVRDDMYTRSSSLSIWYKKASSFV